MNRRNRKKQETGLLDGLKARITEVEMSSIKATWSDLPKLHQRLLMILIPIVIILILVPSPSVESDKTIEMTNSVQVEPERKEVAVNPVSLSEEGGTKQKVTTTDEWQEYTVQSGDTLAKVFRANSLPMADLNALIAIEGLDKPLSKITAGQLVRFKLASEGHLDILQLEKSGSSVMFFRLSDGGYGRSK
ncbi:LysM-like peptidoglycan-binding domain-containing protein [Vibrio algarum]|uniref:LysM-like peptidoglycan-binding domain-containing protein n=1 Tax=Vibrio algarum TaxID=3020714 RepID=A0ABT4YLA0_9VIBR|nr:LysM-like peptidoglycan-binding domain-containing protein [Vibrio sp. KJ40-1]MDB1122303.1 LysM-like peptidoglycan-binding domain-containing protein [Vibrio sp. KJ40-1]